MKRILYFTYGLAILLIVSSFRQNQSFDFKSSVARGKDVYIAKCIACHMDQGQGLEGVFPPLAKSDYLMADKKRSIQQVLYGITGEIKVNGKLYAIDMLGIDMTDKEASDVLNYVRNSWGNKGSAVTPENVKQARKK